MRLGCCATPRADVVTGKRGFAPPQPAAASPRVRVIAQAKEDDHRMQHHYTRQTPRVPFVRDVAAHAVAIGCDRQARPLINMEV